MNTNVREIVWQTIVLFVVAALALFGPAGTIAWPAAWIYLIGFLGFVTVTHFWLLQHNPSLLKERMKGVVRSGQMGWDKLLMSLFELAMIAWLVLIALDAMRFHWSHVPLWVQVSGALLLLASFTLFFSTFRENSYLSTAVRVQQDRGHRVVSTGPYHYVRHPMYSGIVLFSIGTPLMLGSWYGLVAGLILIGMIARRAVLEEQTLRAELQGYVDYTQQVRYRFIPFVW